MTINPIIDFVHRCGRNALLQEAKKQSDGQLLERFVNGQDDVALETLVQRHAPMVWGVCRRTLARHDAEDAFQATFLVFLRKAASIRSRDLLANWLCRVAYQTARKARQRNAKRRIHEGSLNSIPEVPTEAHDASDPELWVQVREELNRLSEKYRTAVVLCELEGRSLRDVAQQLRLPEGTVRSRLARGRAMLAQRLTRRGVTVSVTTVTAVLTEQAASGTVPVALLTKTIQSTTLLATGETVTASLLSPEVSQLTESVLRAITGAKWKAASVVLLMAALAMGAGAVAYHTLPDRPSNLVEPPKDSAEADNEQFGKEAEATKFAKQTLWHDLMSAPTLRFRFGPETKARLNRENRHWTVTGSVWDEDRGDTRAIDWKVIARYQTSDRSWNVVGFKHDGFPKPPRPWPIIKEGVHIKGQFAKPPQSASPVSFLKIVGKNPGWAGINQDNESLYDGSGFNVLPNDRGVTVRVGKLDDPSDDAVVRREWTIKFGARPNHFLEVGDYDYAKRFERWAGLGPGSGDVPGIQITRQMYVDSIGCNGRFVVWEIEVKDNKVIRLAIDFIYGHCPYRGTPLDQYLVTPPLRGSLRLNSSFHLAVPVPEPKDDLLGLNIFIWKDGRAHRAEPR